MSEASIETFGPSSANIWAINSALNNMIAVGHGVEDDVFSENILDAAQSEMDRIRHWLPDEELRGKGHRRPVYLKPRSLVEKVALSGRFVPSIAAMGVILEPIVREFGYSREIPLLANWSCNKAVINKIPGSEEEPGEIKKHTDPRRFSGGLFVVSWEDAEVTVADEEPRQVHRGTLEAFIGQDLAELIPGIVQPPHYVRTKKTRYSGAFANDTTPPLTAKNTFYNFLEVRRA